MTWVEAPQDNTSKIPKKVYIDLDEDDLNRDQKDEDVFILKKVSTPPPTKPYKYFIAKNSHDTTDSTQEEPLYVKLSRRSTDRNILNMSPRSLSKFKSPPGITKAYKRVPTPLPKWWLPPSKPTSNLSSLNRNKFLGLNGNARSTLSEVFNLDEKRNYQELIKRVTGKFKTVEMKRPVEVINLAEDAASFRETQRLQKSTLKHINSLEKDLLADKHNNIAQEYDPITVASINSSDSEVEIVPSESSTSSVRIDPINSLKESYKGRGITSSDWLFKLDTKYRKKKLETQEKLKDARRESDIISKVNSEQKLAQLEHKLKYELSIPESIYEEPQPTVELPPLTPEQEKLVSRALGPGPPGQLLVEKFNLRIHRYVYSISIKFLILAFSYKNNFTIIFELFSE